MASLINTVIYGYNDLMENRSDPRTKDWWLVTSPWPTLTACLSYIYFSKVLGPRIMENRKPFDLRNTLVVYNAIQTVFSFWIFYEYMMSGWWGSYSFKCQPVDYSRSPIAMRMATTCWWYFFSKFTEFFDTLFFILRKKNQHVSTLHVIHHGIMPMSVWFGVRFAPGGHSTFFALLNTFVHIVMYFYYMIAAMGPQYQKYIWWKKYLTTLQMVQFVGIMSHQFQLLFRDCDYPKGFMVWIGFHGILFFFLFSDFYKAKYMRKPPMKKSSTLMIKKQSENGTSPTFERIYSNGNANHENKNGSTHHPSQNGLSNGLLKRVITNGVTDTSQYNGSSNFSAQTNGSIPNGKPTSNGTSVDYSSIKKQ